MSQVITWDIPEGSDDAVVLVVDDAGSPALDAAAIPHLALPSPHALGGVNLGKAESEYPNSPTAQQSDQIHCCSQNFTIITVDLQHGPVRSSSFSRVKIWTYGTIWNPCSHHCGVESLVFCPSDHTFPAHLFDVIPSFELLQEENSFLGFLVALNLVLNNQRKFWNLLNAVT